MRISIIVPIYKVEKEIKRCLSSILTQTYDDIELILVNDASPDHSYFVAKEYINFCRYSESIYKNVMFFEHQENKGLSCARNTGIENATGDYLFFLDSDDELASVDVISKLVNAAVKYNRPDCILGGHRRLSETGQVLDDFKFEEKYYPCNSTIYENYDRGSSQLNDYAPGKLIKKSLFEDRNRELFFLKGIYHEDTLWAFHLYRKCNNLVAFPEIVFNYYQREGAITSSITEKHISDFNTVIEKMYAAFLKNKHYYPFETQREIERRRRECLDKIMEMSSWDKHFFSIEFRRLKAIKISPFTGKLSYFKQNMLFRSPDCFINYRIYNRWKKKRKNRKP